MLDPPPVLAHMTGHCPSCCLEQILDLVILRENTSVPFDWYYLNPFAPCAPLSGSQYRPTFGQQYLENGKSKHGLCQTFFKEYSTSFLMVCRLIDFVLLVLKLLMFKVCVIIGISKMEFFNFSGTEKQILFHTTSFYSMTALITILRIFVAQITLAINLHWFGKNQGREESSILCVSFNIHKRHTT